MYISINFAYLGFLESQRICSESALKIGGFDRAISYGIKDLDPEFLKLTHFQHRRGFGFWVWKPYLIYKTLMETNIGDVIAYIDSGASWASNIKPYIDHMTGDILAFQLKSSKDTETANTKKELLLYMDMDRPEVLNSRQILGGYSIWKNTENSRNVAKEWLDIASKKYLIDDTTCLYNHLGFTDHRHDQSIWSLLCKKKGIQYIEDPSEWGSNSTPGLVRLVNCTRLNK